MKLKIKVTKDILKQSKMCGTEKNVTFTKSKGVGYNCAIGKSIANLFPDAWVYPEKIMFDFFKRDLFLNSSLSLNLTREAKLPKNAQAFIKLFDETSPSKRPNLPEFEFEIEVPEQVIQKIGIQEVHKILSESKTLELV